MLKAKASQNSHEIIDKTRGKVRYFGLCKFFIGKVMLSREYVKWCRTHTR